MSSDSLDPIGQAFEAMRSAALKRNGSVPDLSRQSRRGRGNGWGKKSGGNILGDPTSEAAEQVRVPGLTGDSSDQGVHAQSAQTRGVPLNAAQQGTTEQGNTQQRRRRRGIPTGPDGRRLPRRRDVDRLGSIVNREIRHRGWTREIAGGWVTGHWPELVGEKIAAHTKVEMLKGSTLFISCDSTAWATNLRMMQREILRTIAAKVGPDGITELKIFGPKAPSWRHGALHVAGRGPRDTYG
ncbi:MULTISPECIES: DciA family protein [unclassified Corynebacterium]|uniref:DciA family protein n=1 Tax=unclassified Corynebacterium TaxID=2624378 RepID=UPI0029C9C35B|nr:MULTISPECIES: DciA family protein [unclassified Corynebacterium]